jgi:hypothetical protein
VDVDLAHGLKKPPAHGAYLVVQSRGSLVVSYTHMDELLMMYSLALLAGFLVGVSSTIGVVIWLGRHPSDQDDLRHFE